jgi:hypothetical protein
LEHCSAIEDNRQPCKVMYPLREVLLLVVCGTMAACDDYDDIVLWGNRHLDFLRRLPRRTTVFEQNLRACHPARAFRGERDIAPNYNLFLVHRQLDHTPLSCDDAAPRPANRKRGIHQVSDCSFQARFMESIIQCPRLIRCSTLIRPAIWLFLAGKRSHFSLLCTEPRRT